MMTQMDNINLVYIYTYGKKACYPWANKTAEELKEQFNKFDNNYSGQALITGRISNVFGIDIDDVSNIDEIFENLGIKDPRQTTYSEITPSGGYHIYYKLPEELINYSSHTDIPFKGWDVRCNGGYMLWEGSRYTLNCCIKNGKHKCGADDDITCKRAGMRYAAINDLPIAEMPQALIDLYTSKNKKTVSTIISSNATPSNINQYLELIDANKFLADRPSWIKFLLFCRSNDVSLETFCRISSKAYNHEPCTCEVKWQEEIDQHSNITMGTIKYWAKESNPDEYKKLIDQLFNKQFINQFDYEETYTYIQFSDEYTNKHFDSLCDIKNEVYHKAQKVIRFIMDSSSFIVKMPRTYTMYKSMGHSSFKMTYDDGKKIKSINIMDIVRSEPTLNFNKIDCLLDNEQKDRIFNVWSGYDAKITNNIDIVGVHMMTEFIMKTWAGSNKELFHYIISWFANIVQTHEINGVALVCYSIQGAGKNTLVDFMSLLLGEHNIAEVQGISSITQKHNSVIANKRLIVMNETSSVKDEFRSSFDKLKSCITDRVLTIEDKGFEPRKINNIGNYIMFTNHKDSTIIEGSDRRFQCLEVDRCMVGNLEYFEELRKRCFNKHTADSFYTYLMNYDKCNIRTLINTPLKEDIKSISKPNALKFLDTLEHEKGYKISANTLYAQYSQWCKDDGERPVTNTKFGLLIKDTLERKRTINGNVYVF